MESLEQAANHINVRPCGKIATFFVPDYPAPDNPSDIMTVPHDPYALLRKIVSETDWRWVPSAAIRQSGGYDEVLVRG